MLQKIFNSKVFLVFLFILEVLLIVSSLIFLYFSVWVYSWEVLREADIQTLLMISLPMLAIVSSSIMITLTLKASFNKEPFTKLSLVKKVFLYSYIFLSLAGISFVGFVFYQLFNEPPYQPFPLDDSKAVYTISQKDGFYMINFMTTSERNKKYVCSYEGVKKSCRWELDQTSGGFIASSETDLSLFLDMPLQLSGEFVHAKEQCIAKKCVVFGKGNFLGLRIDSVSKKSD